MRRVGVALVVVAALAACGGDDDGGGGAIEQNVVRPGITAMEQASALACSSDAETLRVAIESYTVLEGEPPPDEAALVAGEYVRAESDLHDVVDGQIVPVDPGCGGTGSVPPTAPPVTELGDIVTSTEPLTPDEMMAELTPEEIAQVGGEACARELVTIFTAGQDYVADRGTDPESLDDLVDGGYLETPITLWVVEDNALLPAEGSGCVDLETADRMTSCTGDARTLVIAREAHFTQNPGGSEPSQADLVAEGFLLTPSEVVDLEDGQVVAVPGGPCEGVDLGV